jgi:hypothetical protein
MDENNPFAAPQTNEEPDQPFEQRLESESMKLSCGLLGFGIVVIALGILWSWLNYSN